MAQSIKSPPTMQETRVQSLIREVPLEKEMAVHSSIRAWEIPWMEEPGRPDCSPWGHKEVHSTEQLHHHHHHGNRFKDERSTDLPRVAQEVSGGAEIRTQVGWLQSLDS